MPDRTCATCRHLVPHPEPHIDRCAAPGGLKTGVRFEREAGHCGPTGSLWEAKEEADAA